MEHLSLFDLALSSVLAGVWLAGVVAAFAHADAKQAVAVVLLDVEHVVVDVQLADAAHQTPADPGPLLNTEEQKRREVGILSTPTRPISFNEGSGLTLA